MGVVPIRIFHLITSLNTGGAERMLAKLVAGMDHDRFENRVVSMLPPGPVAREIQDVGISVDSLDLMRGVPHPGAVLRLVRMLRSFRPDVVQTWLYHADFLGLLASFFAGRPPVVWNIRNADLDLASSNRMTATVLRINAALSKIPAAVVTNSRQAVAFHMQAGYAPKQWEILPNGFDIRLYRPDPAARLELRRELDLPANALLVGHCARFAPVKDHDMFLQAVRLVAQHAPCVHFALCGDGVSADSPDTPLFAQAAADPVLAGRLHLLGRRTRIHQFMAGLDLFCLSSRSEGFPNVLGEAMACGVPCVATDVGDCRDVVGDTGRIVPTGDPRSYADAICNFFSLPPEQRQQLGHAARQRIQFKYSLASVVSNYQKLYEIILSV